MLSLGLMTLDYREKRLTPIRTIVTKYFVYPLQYTVDLPFRFTQFSREFFSDHNELSSANRELRALVGVYAVEAARRSDPHPKPHLKAQALNLPGSRQGPKLTNRAQTCVDY